MDPATTQAVAKAAEESAKTSGKALEIVHDAGGYLRQVIADVPQDLVGVLGGTWLHERHIRLRDRLRRRTEQILQERDVEEVIELSPNMVAALIAGAQEEGSEELMELWARLLANAMDPNLNSVRHSFIEAVKRMDPMDAVVIRLFYERDINALVLEPAGLKPIDLIGVHYIAAEIGCNSDEIEISLRRLKDLSFLDEGNFGGHHQSANKDQTLDLRQWSVNATSRQFLRACYPKVKTG